MQSSESDNPFSASRREVIVAAASLGTLAAAASSGLGATAAQAQQASTARAAAGPVNTRTIGRTNETMTALGLGTFLTFDLLPGQNREQLKEVTRTYLEAGVRVLDTSPLYGTGEASVGAFLSQLGGTDQEWAMGHPAVTTVLSATSNPAHAEQNVGALRGPLPDQAMRARMVKHMETIPGFSGIASMPWYPDKQAMYQGIIRRSQGQLRKRLA